MKLSWNCHEVVMETIFCFYLLPYVTHGVNLSFSFQIKIVLCSDWGEGLFFFKSEKEKEKTTFWQLTLNVDLLITFILCQNLTCITSPLQETQLRALKMGEKLPPVQLFLQCYMSDPADVSWLFSLNPNNPVSRMWNGPISHWSRYSVGLICWKQGSSPSFGVVFFSQDPAKVLKHVSGCMYMQDIHFPPVSISGGQAVRLDKKRCGGGGGGWSDGCWAEWRSSPWWPTAGARTRKVRGSLGPALGSLCQLDGRQEGRLYRWNHNNNVEPHYSCKESRIRCLNKGHCLLKNTHFFHTFGILLLQTDYRPFYGHQSS